MADKRYDSDGNPYPSTTSSSRISSGGKVSWNNYSGSKATIGNCRIRTAFHLNDGLAVYYVLYLVFDCSLNLRVYKTQPKLLLGLRFVYP